MYDFKALSAYDFELLSMDLLQKFLACHLEGFKQGRDDGIDLRYTIDSHKTIIQCKHYANSSFSTLKSHLKNIELSKIILLEPIRYILVTSLELSPRQKDELLHILAPFCQSSADILGNNEINSLLRAHPEVERIHYKLWLTSTGVLQKVLHSKVYNRSNISLEKIKQKLRLYVQNNAFEKAIKILDEKKYCIISGIPGIGKTTLAEIIIIKYLEMGYEIIKVSQNIDEALQVCSYDQKQLFYYDDFLGKIGLDIALPKNEDTDLISFINSIQHKPNTKFILTTREYILNQAKEKYELLSQSGFDVNKCTIKLDDYTKHDKARIFYNHIYFSENITLQHIENLLNNDILKIINHKNYNPRVIELLTSVLLPVEPSQFFEQITSNLENPHQIWGNAFEKQISFSGRSFLLMLLSLPSSALLEKIEPIFKYYLSERCKIYNESIPENAFLRAVKELEGTFIVCDKHSKTSYNMIFVSFHNPSVNDFLSNYVFENDIEYKILCDTAMCFEQCSILYNLSTLKNHVLIKKHSQEYAKSLIENFWAKTQFGYYRTSSFSQQLSPLSTIDRIIFLIEANKVINNPLINNFLQTDFFQNLESNIFYYNESLKQYNNLFNYMILGGENTLIDEAIAKVVLNYGLNQIEDEKVEELDEYLLFRTIERFFPALITDEIRDRVSCQLENYLDDDFSIEKEWDDEDTIKSYIDLTTSLGDYYSVNYVYPLKYLHQKLEDLHYKQNDDDEYERYREFKSADNFSDIQIRDIFFGLKAGFPGKP